MSVDYDQLRPQVSHLGRRAVSREKRLHDLRQKARAVLEDQAHRQGELGDKVDRAAREDPGLRCARPGEENLRYIGELPAPASSLGVLAVDGSQINPDPHGPVEYYLINVGGIYQDVGSEVPPSTFLDSQLKFDQELYTEYGLVSPSYVGLQRDLGERLKLVQWLRGITDQDAPTGLLVALTDGPLELWEPRDRFGKRSSHFQEGLQQYTAALGEVAELGGIPAGYVDRPRADLVVRLLELVLRDEAEAGVGGSQRLFFGVTDADLFLPLLKPGQRSAVFSIQSSSADDYPGQLALHFFYLQVGSAGSPALARVEVPAWVIKDQERLDALHALLVEQCRTLGGRGYPYLLHRAHEIAVVQRGDRELLTEMIRRERLAHGLSMGRKSPKQYYKDLPGRKRYR